MGCVCSKSSRVVSYTVPQRSHSEIAKETSDRKQRDKWHDQLYRAAYDGVVPELQRLIRAGANVNQDLDDKGTSALWFVAFDGIYAAVEMLLHAGANVNQARTSGGMSPLYVAVQNGHFDVAVLLIQNGPNVNQARTDSGASPLYIAVEKGHEKLAELLLQNGADVNQARTTDGMTPLHIAAEHDKFELVFLLLENGAVIDQPKASGCAPLYTACQEGHRRVVELLLRRGANPNLPGGGGGLPLWNAAGEGHVEVVELLLRAGANIDGQNSPRSLNSEGHTALHGAAETGKFVVLLALLQWKASVNLTDAKGRTALHVAAEMLRPLIVRMLMRRGHARTDLKDSQGKLPVAYGNEDVQLELQPEANWRLLDGVCFRPLQYVEQLLREGLREGARYRAFTEAVLAPFRRHNPSQTPRRVVPADPNSATGEGVTALMLAAIYSNAEHAAALLRHGAA
eukprot:RCo006469